MSVAMNYLNSVLYRARQPLEPVGFQPDWSDRPRPHKFYPSAELFPLPRDTSSLGSVQAALANTSSQSGRGFTLPLLGELLFNSYALLSRRLAIHANENLIDLPRYETTNWARGAASGGGLYPVTIYWISGSDGPLLPGVYHYACHHHALQRLLTGDVTSEVKAAIGDSRQLGDARHYLVIGIKFWQNSFKYNSFSYHAITMDVGVALQTWRMLSQAMGIALRPVLWFNEARINQLLGLNKEVESTFAIVPLPWRGSRPTSASQNLSQAVANYTSIADSDAHRYAPIQVSAADQERSKRVVSFPMLRDVHNATYHDTSTRPNSKMLESAAVRRSTRHHSIQLPAPQTLRTSLQTALRSRRSSYGRFSSEPALSARALSTVLTAASTSSRLHCDVFTTGSSYDLAKLYTFANHVEAVPPGCYEFDPISGSLGLVHAGSRGAFLQQNYFLDNYSVDQAAAVIVPAIRSSAVIKAYGDRGYRLANALVGAIAQGTYVACAALGIGCGAALGFDNISYREELRLADAEEVPLLMLMVGNERTTGANFRYEMT